MQTVHVGVERNGAVLHLSVPLLTLPHRLDMSAKAGKPAFVPPGTQKLAEAPTRAAGAAMMRKLKQALEVGCC